MNLFKRKTNQIEKHTPTRKIINTPSHYILPLENLYIVDHIFLPFYLTLSLGDTTNYRASFGISDIHLYDKVGELIKDPIPHFNHYLMQEKCVSATASKTGILEITFTNHKIISYPDEDYESWSFGDSEDLKIVCMAKGEYAIWSPTTYKTHFDGGVPEALVKVYNLNPENNYIPVSFSFSKGDDSSDDEKISVYMMNKKYPNNGFSWMKLSTKTGKLPKVGEEFYILDGRQMPFKIVVVKSPFDEFEDKVE